MSIFCCNIIIILFYIDILSTVSIFIVFLSYTLMPDAPYGKELSSIITIFPLILFGFGHALFVTLSSPLIK